MRSACGRADVAASHLYHGDLIQLKSGDILGHEPCGIVESVGSAVKHFKAGDVSRRSLAELR